MGRPPLVAVRLRGRLGNHLFQYALGRALTPEGPVVVDELHASHAELAGALRPGEVRPVTLAEAWSLRQPPPLRRGRKRLVHHLDRGSVPDALHVWLHERRVAEPAEGVFQPELLELGGPVLLEGYFQHEGYVLPVADRIVDALRPPGPAVQQGLAVLDGATDNGPTVAVVARAGHDYEDEGWVHPVRWYLEAAAEVARSVPGARFAVFSDVPLAAEALAEALRPIGPAVALVRADPLTQLHLIAAMDHAVVAATSFGWWGAWLGDQRSRTGDRLVIAPDPWLRRDLDDIPPARWARAPL